MPNAFYGKKTNEIIILDEEETSHLKVMRKKTDELIQVITGDGFLYKAKINKIGKKQTTLEILDEEDKNESYEPYISIYFGMSKWNRTQILLEKLVELRVNQFYVFRGEKSDIMYKNLIKFQKAIIEACKQTIYPVIPQIDFTTIENISKQNTIILDLIEKRKDIKSFLKENKKPKNINIVIGPDSGFSENEKEYFCSKGFEIINLGNSIFRFETSAIYTASIINYEFDRLHI